MTAIPLIRLAKIIRKFVNAFDKEIFKTTLT